MLNMFGGMAQQQSGKTINIKDDLCYTTAQADMLALLGNQVSSKLDTTNVMLYDSIHNIASIMKESGHREFVYDNVKFTIDFLGLINVELTH